MNILIFYQYFGTTKGGWSTRMYEFPKRWIESGHKVTIVTSPYDKSDVKATKFIEKQLIDGINVIIINIKQSNKHSLLYRAYTFFLFSVISIYYALTLNFDVVICSSGPITIGVPGIFTKIFRKKKKFVFEVRDLWPDGAIQLGLLTNTSLIKFAYIFEKYCYKNADLIVTCSEGMSHSVREKFNTTKIISIPNACDYSFFQEQDLTNILPSWVKGKKIFIYTGSMGLMDDCMQIIYGIEMVKRKDLVFVFIGEGKEKKDLEQYVDQHHIPDIFFTGLIPKTNVRLWLQHSYAAFVTFKNIPMLQTSSPNKMFDAFASGVPVMQTTTGWIKDLVEREHCGLNASPDNPEDLARAIEKMADNNFLHQQMKKNALRLAQTTFNRDILAKEYIDELKGLNN
jgi:glycosyltransferase involved in cell wall biosynthesis